MHCDTQPKKPHQMTLAERRAERIRRWELHKAVIEAIFKGLMVNKHHKNITARMHQAVRDEVLKVFPKPDGWETEYWPGYPSICFHPWTIEVFNNQPGLHHEHSRCILYVGCQYGGVEDKAMTWQEHAERSYKGQTETLTHFIERERLLSLNDKALEILAERVLLVRKDARNLLLNSGVDVDKRNYDLSYDHPLLFGEPKKRDYDQL